MPEPDDTISRVNSGEPMSLEQLYRARATLDRFTSDRRPERREARAKVGAMINDQEGPRPTGTSAFSDPSARIVCPHCHTRGGVTTKQMKVKKGISGSKATGALLTGGTSVLLTGLSRKEKATEATCGHCHVTWYV